jgi:hypothetical protein
MQKCKCKSCGADIKYIKSESGKYIPCDIELKPYFEDEGKQLIVMELGKVLTGLFVEPNHMKPYNNYKYAYQSHFDTCPNAAAHRKTKEQMQKFEQITMI